MVYGFAALLILGALIGDSEETNEAVPAAEAVQEEAPRNGSPDQAIDPERVALERARDRLRKERARLRRERAQARREQPVAPPAPEPEAEASCHPSYDPCLDTNAADYDCENGSGDGPMYTGFVTVTGSDDYDLDSDGDGTGCES